MHVTEEGAMMYMDEEEGGGGVVRRSPVRCLAVGQHPVYGWPSVLATIGRPPQERGQGAPASQIALRKTSCRTRSFSVDTWAMLKGLFGFYHPIFAAGVVWTKWRGPCIEFGSSLDR